ncbi:DNA-binding protein [Bacillus sp. EB106-08-02-XG196]|uniref:DNA-binding protein n=1 Tax=unclassified Bacillus (in: firmicutes) TaxID=185979 RepID=UPI000BA58506|nr:MULTISPECIES: DNA-binding protein [unclassified Bacillus (in: firmicutes)]NWQ42678.1 DNA-binding protein [Bacillus sp. EB106-08-02-XG196]PAE44066.1 hypothetical protein CHI06_03270 [Bacillus sp. 7884-1]
MENDKMPKEKPIVCSVVTELQAAQVAKLCESYDIQAIIRMKPFVDISHLKKTVKAKMKEKLYEPCPCGKGKKFKFCCYQTEVDIKL